MPDDRDHCTSSPDVIWGVNISYCCAFHDDEYRRGGSEEDRRIADYEFKGCIDARLYVAGVGWWKRWMTRNAYWMGVRLFGWPKRHFRWGHKQL